MLYHLCISVLLLEYTIKKIQENKEKMEMNSTHHILVYTDDVTVLGKNINTIKNNMEAVLDASREDYLEINAEKITYMFMFCHQTAG
jgi:hypothetical protein